MTKAAYVEKYMAEERDRTCHQCQCVLTKEDAVVGLEEGIIKIQVFTGRVFCSDECWNQYLRNEGMLPR